MADSYKKTSTLSAPEDLGNNLGCLRERPLEIGRDGKEAFERTEQSVGSDRGWVGRPSDATVAACS